MYCSFKLICHHKSGEFGYLPRRKLVKVGGAIVLWKFLGSIFQIKIKKNQILKKIRVFLVE
jgi:hypothetical protein